jgi:hypothetical protein
MSITVAGNRIIAQVEQEPVFDLIDKDFSFYTGEIALVWTIGRIETQKISIIQSL